jgi:CHAD domain-containing protein
VIRVEHDASAEGLEPEDPCDEARQHQLCHAPADGPDIVRFGAVHRRDGILCRPVQFDIRHVGTVITQDERAGILPVELSLKVSTPPRQRPVVLRCVGQVRTIHPFGHQVGIPVGVSRPKCKRLVDRRCQRRACVGKRTRFGYLTLVKAGLTRAATGKPVGMKVLLERELKFEVDERFTLPRLDDILPDARVVPTTVELSSAYYDTADGDLQSHGMTLRRRDGDDDTGWQLKVPDAEGRTEIRTALSDTPPAELVELLTGITLGKPLTNVATIRTVRDRHRLVGPTQDRLVTEVDDDHVRASMDHRLLAWREIEIEFGDETPAIARRLVKRLADAGARPSRHPNKLARVRPAPTSTATVDTPAGRSLVDYMTTQIDAVFAGDLALRRGSDPIHDTRVAIRRLRSTVRVFGKLLDRAAVGDIDAELKWFAGLLGEVRDCHVQRRRFRQALAEWPVDLVLGPVANRITTDLRSVELPARRRVAEAMTSQRYLDLLATLQQWRLTPPMIDSPTTSALEKRARRAQRKADKRLAEALDADDDALLHRARKAAKRARYAAELRQPIDTNAKKAKKTVKSYKKIQTVLGDHQDSVVAAATLMRLARTAGTTVGENGFTYGLLYAREQQLAQEARRKVRGLG